MRFSLMGLETPESMKKLVEKVKQIIPLLIEDYTAEDTGSFDFVKRKNEIMRELDFCKKTGNVVGIYSPKMGPGLFLVGVADIIYDIKSETILFHSHDIGGYKLAVPSVSIEEIDKIIPFNNRFVKPDLSILSETAEITKYIVRKAQTEATAHERRRRDAA
jgi:hypothetical protein